MIDVISDYQLGDSYSQRILALTMVQPIISDQESSDSDAEIEIIESEEPFDWEQMSYVPFERDQSISQLLKRSQNVLTNPIFLEDEAIEIITELANYEGKEFHEILKNTFNAATLALVRQNIISADEAFHYFSLSLSDNEGKIGAQGTLVEYFAQHLFQRHAHIADQFMALFDRAANVPILWHEEAGMEQYRTQLYFFALANNMPLQRAPIAFPSDQRSLFKGRAKRAEEQNQLAKLLNDSSDFLHRGIYSIDALVPLIDRIYAHQGHLEVVVQNLVNAVSLRLMLLHRLPSREAHNLFTDALAKKPEALIKLRELCEQELFALHPHDLDKFFDLFERLGPKGHNVQGMSPRDGWRHHPSAYDYFSHMWCNEFLDQ
ncbi:MAG: hypothetical protein BWZ03_00197 [bacterium ADurb.BinA186]|nr:MAG: hypothetical protein BWZ03_00197 [bacterium ADurb.BinA186]